jgi:lysine biosynthesis protein LysW
MVKCTECGAEINLITPTKGALVDCPGCGTGLEIINNNPIILQTALHEEVDWGEYWGE